MLSPAVSARGELAQERGGPLFLGCLHSSNLFYGTGLPGLLGIGVLKEQEMKGPIIAKWRLACQCLEQRSRGWTRLPTRSPAVGRHRRLPVLGLSGRAQHPEDARVALEGEASKWPLSGSSAVPLEQQARAAPTYCRLVPTLCSRDVGTRQSSGWGRVLGRGEEPVRREGVS